ncbi:hypothetical protein D3C75_931740 [compost metagenome]
MFAGIGLQRQHFAVGGTDIQGIADLQRSILVFSAGTVALWNIAGMGNPRHLQLADVRLVDLIQRGKTVTVGGIPPMFPVFLLTTGSHRFNRDIFLGRHQWRRHKGVTKSGHQRNRQQPSQRIADEAANRMTGTFLQPWIGQRGQEGQHAEHKQA